ncbi:MAG: PD40 domain-containing protein [Acidobacteria bacterium]|nr:PD40 domain-containing protein [Acidobacteriota bacterium]MBI3425250.1 PD40 domain-containing protein [Acidobacteriota bacterium]
MVDTNRVSLTSLWEVAADGANPHPLQPGWSNPAAECCGNWTADGRYFVFQSIRNGATNIWAMREQAGLFRRAGQEPVQLTIGPLNYYAPVPSQDGKKLFVVGEQRRGEMARHDMKTQQWVGYLSGISAERLDFSQDGEWVAYQTYPEGSLWRMKVDGSERLQLTYPPLQATLPRWSPDGKQIAITANMPNQPENIYLISAEGGSPQQLIPDERREGDASWSPDGNSLAFWAAAMSLKPAGIYLLEIRTRQVSLLPGSEGLYSPRWSPDGRYIAAIPNGLWNKLLLFDLTTQKWAELATQRANWPHWSRDGKFFYFPSIRENDPAVCRIRIGDRKIEWVASLKGLRIAAASGIWIGWAPDDSPLVLRDVGTQDIYALDWQTP